MGAAVAVGRLSLGKWAAMDDDRAPLEPRYRRFPSPAAQRRAAEHWKARLGLAAVAILLLGAGVVVLRLVRPG